MSVKHRSETISFRSISEKCSLCRACHLSESQQQNIIQKCIFKYIDRNHLKADMSAIITKPIRSMWIHVAIYYKYSTYQNIGAEYWDDFCGWLGGKKMSYALTAYKPIIKKYTNFNHSCPYTGTLLFKFNNFSAQSLAFPQIVPSGRYRIEVDFWEDDRKTFLFGVFAYTSISDYRLEVVQRKKKKHFKATLIQ